MHVYALLKASETALELPSGIRGSLQLVTQRQVAAVVELDLSLEQLQQNDAQLLEAVLMHDRIIQDLFRQTTVLPLRFSSFPTLHQLAADLEAQHSSYLEALTQLNGKVEHCIHLTPVELVEPAIATTLKGKDYFLAKKQQQQQQQRQRDLQLQEFDRIAATVSSRHSTQIDAENHKLYVLLDRAESEKLQREILMLQQRCLQWQLLLGEALPPFHFV